MNEEMIFAMIEEIDLPFAYHHFAEGEAPDLPYLLYLYPESIEFAADDRPYARGSALQIELYSETRDIGLEYQVESALEKYGLFYHKREEYIESERFYEIIYEMEVPVMG